MTGLNQPDLVAVWRPTIPGPTSRERRDNVLASPCPRQTSSTWLFDNRPRVAVANGVLHRNTIEELHATTDRCPSARQSLYPWTVGVGSWLCVKTSNIDEYTHCVILQELALMSGLWRHGDSVQGTLCFSREYRGCDENVPRRKLQFLRNNLICHYSQGYCTLILQICYVV